MKVAYAYPPNIDLIRRFFRPGPGTLFCYGDTIYFPAGGDLPETLHAHEEVHSRRQGDDPDLWWDRYLQDAEFRLLEEVLAHRAEYRAFQGDRRERRLFLRSVAARLSGPLYGRMVTFEKAKRLIKET